MVARRGADELAALLRQNARNGLRVFAPQGFAGEDHHAGVNGIRMQTRRLIGLVDDGAQGRVIDEFLVLVRRERHRRLVKRFA